MGNTPTPGAHAGSIRVRDSAAPSPLKCTHGAHRAARRTDPFVFFSREETRIHVHVAHPDGEAKFWLAPTVMLASHTGLSQRQLQLAQTVVKAHFEEIKNA